MTDSLSDSPTWIQEMLAHLKMIYSKYAELFHSFTVYVKGASPFAIRKVQSFWAFAFLSAVQDFIFVVLKMRRIS